ncbi:hypothetical protein CROQUDRAFT_658282 [Cronartium quercuum f. sp. fusiforme G11]|uniref:Biopterin-dependent aromatic amino acid hydroxylase family profile domain-containing protein n=1 Tax=Cronartium quercuum f. sp. fusiforme G11 TaxID=708437 RepID=A0A9P6NHM2_9BASI|nr:hypothetical protein CROQUDRAFT_658282 [Cronartium quercuum f. sp. fusiforme G11]
MVYYSQFGDFMNLDGNQSIRTFHHIMFEIMNVLHCSSYWSRDQSGLIGSEGEMRGIKGGSIKAGVRWD